MSAPGAAKLVFSAFFNFGTSGVDAAGRSWVEIGNNVSGYYFCCYFQFFSSVTTFPHRRTARIQKLI